MLTVETGQNYCAECGSPIPDGQRCCSMCYGDIDHGRDGYYRAWAERQGVQSQPEDEPLVLRTPEDDEF